MRTVGCARSAKASRRLKICAARGAGARASVPLVVSRRVPRGRAGASTTAHGLGVKNKKIRSKTHIRDASFRSYWVHPFVALPQTHLKRSHPHVEGGPEEDICLSIAIRRLSPDLPLRLRSAVLPCPPSLIPSRRPPRTATPTAWGIPRPRTTTRRTTTRAPRALRRSPRHVLPPRFPPCRFPTR